MKVEYLTHMGSDINVVNAARVSFDKASVPASFQYAELGGGVEAPVNRNLAHGQSAAAG